MNVSFDCADRVQMYVVSGYSCRGEVEVISLVGERAGFVLKRDVRNDWVDSKVSKCESISYQ